MKTTIFKKTSYLFSLLIIVTITFGFKNDNYKVIEDISSSYTIPFAQVESEIENVLGPQMDEGKMYSLKYDESNDEVQIERIAVIVPTKKICSADNKRDVSACVATHFRVGRTCVLTGRTDDGEYFALDCEIIIL